jgi:hypothetical protein
MTAVCQEDREVSQPCFSLPQFVVATHQETVCIMFPLTNGKGGCGVRVTVVRNHKLPNVHDVL